MPKERSIKRSKHQQPGGQAQWSQHKKKEDRQLKQLNQAVREEPKDKSQEARQGQEATSKWHIPLRSPRQELTQGSGVRNVRCFQERSKRYEESEKLSETKDFSYFRRCAWKSTSLQYGPQAEGGRQLYASPLADDVKRKDETSTATVTRTTQGNTGNKAYGQSKQTVEKESWTDWCRARGTLRSMGASREEIYPSDEERIVCADAATAPMATRKKGELTENRDTLLREAKTEGRTREREEFVPSEAREDCVFVQDIGSHMHRQVRKEDTSNANWWKNVYAETGWWRELTENRETDSPKDMAVKTSTVDKGKNLSTVESGETGCVEERAESISAEKSDETVLKEEGCETVSSEESGETVLKEEGCETVSSEESGETVSTEESGETVSTEESGETVSTEESGETVSTEESSETVSSEESWETASTEESGETVSTEESDETASTEESGEAVSTGESSENVSVEQSSDNVILEVVEDASPDVMHKDIFSGDREKKVSSEECSEDVIIEGSEEDTSPEEKRVNPSAKDRWDYISTKEGGGDGYVEGKLGYVSTEFKRSTSWDCKEWETTTAETGGEEMASDKKLTGELFRAKWADLPSGDKWDDSPSTDKSDDFSSRDNWDDFLSGDDWDDFPSGDKWDTIAFRNKLDRLSLKSDRKDFSSSRGCRGSSGRKCKDVPSGTNHEHTSCRSKWKRKPLGPQQEQVSLGIKRELISSATRGEYSTSKYKQNRVPNENQRGRASARPKYDFMGSRSKQEHVYSGTRGDLVPSGCKVDRMSSGTKQECIPSGTKGVSVPSLMECRASSSTRVQDATSGIEWEKVPEGSDWEDGNSKGNWECVLSGSKEEDISSGTRLGDRSSKTKGEYASGNAWKALPSGTGWEALSLIKEETSTTELGKLSLGNDWEDGSSKDKMEYIPPRLKENVRGRTKWKERFSRKKGGYSSTGTAFRNVPSLSYWEAPSSTIFKDKTSRTEWRRKVSLGNKGEDKNSVGKLKFVPTESKEKVLARNKWSVGSSKTKGKFTSIGTAQKNLFLGTEREMSPSTKIKDEVFGADCGNLSAGSERKNADSKGKLECIPSESKKDNLVGTKWRDESLKTKGERASSGTVQKDVPLRTGWGNAHSKDSWESASRKPLGKGTMFVGNKRDESSKPKGKYASKRTPQKDVPSGTGWRDAHSNDSWRGASGKPLERGTVFTQNKLDKFSKTKGEYASTGTAEKDVLSGTGWGNVSVKSVDKKKLSVEKWDGSSKTQGECASTGTAQKSVLSENGWKHAQISDSWEGVSEKPLDNGIKFMENKGNGAREWCMEEQFTEESVKGDKGLKMKSSGSEGIFKSKRPSETTFPKKHSMLLCEWPPVLPPDKPGLVPPPDKPELVLPSDKPGLVPQVGQKPLQPKTRLFITSTHLPVLRAVSECIIRTAQVKELLVKGPTPMRNKHLNVTVRRSPSGQGSKTWDHFVMTVHKRIIDIYSPPLVTQCIIDEVSQEHRDMHKVHIKVSASA